MSDLENLIKNYGTLTHSFGDDPTHSLKNLLSGGECYSHRQSHTGELAMRFEFSKPVHVKSFMLQGMKQYYDNGPKHIKFFVNADKNFDFNLSFLSFGALSIATPTAAMTLYRDQITPAWGNIGLTGIPFQNVSTLIIYIANNQATLDCTIIGNFALWGNPVVRDEDTNLYPSYVGDVIIYGLGTGCRNTDVFEGLKIHASFTKLIIDVTFNGHVKLTSLIIFCSTPNGPKNIKIFADPMQQITNFEQARNATPSTKLALNTSNFENLYLSETIKLVGNKYERVKRLTLYVEDNQSGTDSTEISHVSIMGHPL